MALAALQSGAESFLVDVIQKAYTQSVHAPPRAVLCPEQLRWAAGEVHRHSLASESPQAHRRTSAELWALHDQGVLDATDLRALRRMGMLQRRGSEGPDRFACLSDDMLQAIFERCPTRSIGVLASVCRRFRRVASSRRCRACVLQRRYPDAILSACSAALPFEDPAAFVTALRSFLPWECYGTPLRPEFHSEMGRQCPACVAPTKPESFFHVRPGSVRALVAGDAPPLPRVSALRASNAVEATNCFPVFECAQCGFAHDVTHRLRCDAQDPALFAPGDTPLGISGCFYCGGLRLVDPASSPQERGAEGVPCRACAEIAEACEACGATIPSDSPRHTMSCETCGIIMCTECICAADELKCRSCQREDALRALREESSDVFPTGDLAQILSEMASREAAALQAAGPSGETVIVRENDDEEGEEEDDTPLPTGRPTKRARIETITVVAEPSPEEKADPDWNLLPPHPFYAEESGAWCVLGEQEVPCPGEEDGSSSEWESVASTSTDTEESEEYTQAARVQLATLIDGHIPRAPPGTTGVDNTRTFVGASVHLMIDEIPVNMDTLYWHYRKLIEGGGGSVMSLARAVCHVPPPTHPHPLGEAIVVVLSLAAESRHCDAIFTKHGDAVVPAWLDACLAAGRIVDVAPYRLQTYALYLRTFEPPAVPPRPGASDDSLLLRLPPETRRLVLSRVEPQSLACCVAVACRQIHREAMEDAVWRAQFLARWGEVEYRSWIAKAQHASAFEVFRCRWEHDRAMELKFNRSDMYHPSESVMEEMSRAARLHINAVREGCMYSFDGETEDRFREVVDRFLADPATAATETLTLGTWSTENDGTPDTILCPMVLPSSILHLAGLRGLFVGDISQEENEISWINLSEISPVLRAYPELRVLKLHGSVDLGFSSVSHDRLTSLSIKCGGLPGEVLRGVLASRLPRLTRLTLYFGMRDYGASWGIEDLHPLLSPDGTCFPMLSHLGLRDSEAEDEICQKLTRAAILRTIDSLSVGLGTLSDVGGEALLKLAGHLREEEETAHARFEPPREDAETDPAKWRLAFHLTFIDARHNFLSEPMKAQLEAAFGPLGVALDLDRHTAGHPDGYRYVAVGE